MIDLLSEQERNEITQISEKTTKEEIVRYYTLSDVDLVIANKYRTDPNRLGFSIQLCVLRHIGWQLNYIKNVPDIIISFVAEQLKINPDAFHDYYDRKNTIFDHFKDIKNLYGYEIFSTRSNTSCFEFLNKLFEKSDNVYFIILNLIEKLKSMKIIPPAIYKVEEIISQERVKFEEKILHMISSEITETQRIRIDDLLNIPENGTTTTLIWLRENNGKSSTDEFLDTVKKLEVINSIKLNLDLKKYPSYKIDTYVKLGKRYEPYSFKRFEENKRYAILAVYLQDQKQNIIDKLITIHDVRINDVFSKIRKTQDENLKAQKKKIKDTVEEYIDFGDTIISAKNEQQNIDDTIEKLITWDKFKVSIVEAKKLFNSANKNTLDFLNKYYNDFRKYTPKLLKVLNFQATSSHCNELISAVDIINNLNNTNKNIISDEIDVNFTNKKWKKCIEDKTGVEKRHYFEMAVLNELRNRIRSGDVSVQESKNFKNFEDYLVSKEDWEKETSQTKLKVELSFDEYLKSKEKKLNILLKNYSKNVDLFNEIIGEDNKIHLKKIEKNTPKEAEELSESLYKMIPKIALPDLLYEILNITNFHKNFVHAATQKSVESIEDISLLIFTIMAIGTNIGISNMAQSLPNISYRQLSNMADWRLLDENILQAQITIANCQSKEYITKFWGDGTTSSSDGMRVKTSVNALNASLNPHFGAEKGITIYRFVNDQYAAFYVSVSGPNDRDGIHVVDGILKHGCEFNIKEHYTDTAGYTYQVFAITSLVGVRFAPRIRNLPDSKLFCFDRDSYPKLKKLVTGTINTNLIRDNFDDILRLTHSIVEGNATGELVLRKLGSYSRNNALANALKEMGKIEKTIFILEYASDPEFRRRVHVGLNKGEEMNGLARVVFFGRRGQFWEHDYQEQFQKASCLNIIINAIVHWNTKYLGKAWEHYKSEHPDADEKLLKHISPLNWKHINFLGEYSFNNNVEYDKDNLRKLNIF